MSTTEWINLAELDKKFAARRPLIKKLMETFLKTYNNFTPAMQEKLNAGDEKGLLVEFHSLKGAAGSLGAVRLHATVEQLEKQIKLQTLGFQAALEALAVIWPSVLEDTETVLREIDANPLN